MVFVLGWDSHGSWLAYKRGIEVLWQALVCFRLFVKMKLLFATVLLAVCAAAQVG